MPDILRRIAGLARLCIAGPGGRIGLALFVSVFCLDLVGIQVTLWLVAWTANFYNALQKLDVEEAVRQIGVFFALSGTSALLYLVGTYLRRMLQIRWRTTLTSAALDRWMGAKAYWRLWLEARGEDIDNPDQRISEDCRIFVTKLTEEALELLSKIVAIFSYVALLWSLSTFPLAFSLFGFGVEIPRYMVWAAPIYVLIASLATHLLGSPLHRLNVEQQHREADFRFALARMRESVEPIAMANGEPAERRILDRRFQRIAENWRRLIRREFILGCFTRPYFQTVLRVPLFLALPAFLAGKVTLGGLMQIGSAFQNVVMTLSWFIFSYRDLIQLAAAAARLDRFFAATGEAASADSGIAIARSDDDRLSIRDLRLRAPGGKELLHFPELIVEPGATVWIAGRSGVGKSTLLRALAGLWPHGEGAIRAPDANAMFLPQFAYAPLDSLAAAAAYPSPPEAVGKDAIACALKEVGLDPVAAADNDGDAAKKLSGGERQRLGVARLLIHRPRWAFLDESFSALDVEAERALMTVLRARLPGTTFVIVSHRPPAGAGEIIRVDIEAFSAEPPARDDRATTQTAAAFA